jgi:hypothetical protein
MSGLEVVAAITSILGAFNGSVTIYRSWRDARRERREKEENRRLERSLTVGSTTVQQEYDTHFARLGQRFAIGDGKCFPPRRVVVKERKKKRSLAKNLPSQVGQGRSFPNTLLNSNTPLSR